MPLRHGGSRNRTGGYHQERRERRSSWRFRRGRGRPFGGERDRESRRERYLCCRRRHAYGGEATLDGVVEATNETGGNAVETARAVASSAAEAVGGFGTTAVSSVRDILLVLLRASRMLQTPLCPDTAARLDDRDRIPPPDRTASHGPYPSSGITSLAQALPRLHPHAGSLPEGNGQLGAGV